MMNSAFLQHISYTTWWMAILKAQLILSTAAKDVYYFFRTLKKFGGHLSRPRQKKQCDTQRQFITFF